VSWSWTTTGSSPPPLSKFGSLMILPAHRLIAFEHPAAGIKIPQTSAES
jgi:hypothetical protein